MKTILEVTLIVAVVVLMGMTKEAEASLMNGYFGGSISSVTYCTCVADYGMLLNIKSPGIGMPTMVFYKPGSSRLRANYNVFTSGPNVVGSYTRMPKMCMMQATPYCIPSGFAYGTIDTIIGVGTSSH
jgi:hypothetical protein